MQVSPVLTPQEFAKIHNAKCSLHSIAQSLDGVMNDKLHARFEKAIAEIDEALANAYKQDDAESSKRFDHFEEVGNKIGIRWTVWSATEVENLYSKHPFTHARMLRYEVNDGVFETAVLGATWADLWLTAEEVIRISGDNHHIFIEGFRPTEDSKVLNLSTGS